MGEFASKGVAGSALGLGIAGLSVGLLNNNGNGLLGGLFGNNGCQNQVSMLQSENAMLKAEKYSDQSIANVYTALRNETQALSDRLLDKYISPIAQEVAQIQVRDARMEEQIKCIQETSALREQLVREQIGRRIDQCCCETNGRINTLSGQVFNLTQTLNGITSTVIPQTAICPPVMPRYNSFVTPTDTAPATQPIVGTVDVNR